MYVYVLYLLILGNWIQNSVAMKCYRCESPQGDCSTGVCDGEWCTAAILENRATGARTVQKGCSGNNPTGASTEGCVKDPLPDGTDSYRCGCTVTSNSNGDFCNSETNVARMKDMLNNRFIISNGANPAAGGGQTVFGAGGSPQPGPTNQFPSTSNTTQTGTGEGAVAGQQPSNPLVSGQPQDQSQLGGQQGQSSTGGNGQQGSPFTGTNGQQGPSSIGTNVQQGPSSIGTNVQQGSSSIGTNVQQGSSSIGQQGSPFSGSNGQQGPSSNGANGQQLSSSSSSSISPQGGASGQFPPQSGAGPNSPQFPSSAGGNPNQSVGSSSNPQFAGSSNPTLGATSNSQFPSQPGNGQFPLQTTFNPQFPPGAIGGNVDNGQAIQPTPNGQPDVGNANAANPANPTGPNGSSPVLGGNQNPINNSISNAITARPNSGETLTCACNGPSCNGPCKGAVCYEITFPANSVPNQAFSGGQREIVQTGCTEDRNVLVGGSRHLSRRINDYRFKMNGQEVTVPSAQARYCRDGDFCNSAGTSPVTILLTLLSICTAFLFRPY